MAYDCFCDYEHPDVYTKTKPTARLAHKCNECGRAINPGDQYEKVFGVWDGRADTFKSGATTKVTRRASARSLLTAVLCGKL